MSIRTQLKDLRVKRKQLAEQTSELVINASKNNRAMTPAENEQWEKRHQDIDILAGQIAKLERDEELDNNLSRVTDRRTAGWEDMVHHATIGGDHDDAPSLPTRMSREQRDTCRRYLLGGLEGLTPNERQTYMKAPGDEVRALGGSGATGDYTIPQGFVYDLNVALKWYGGIISKGVCTYLDTTMGNTMPYPNVDDTANSGEITAENGTVTVTTSMTTPADPTFSVVNFNANMYDSGICQIPIQLMQDSAFNLESYLIGSPEIENPTGTSGLLSVRLGRKLNRDCTLGNGTNQPMGIVTAAALGVSGSSPTGTTYNEIMDLEHSVDPAYRGSDVYGTPRAKFMFNDTTLKYLKKLTDSNGRPLWLAGGVSEGVQAGRPDRFDNFLYVVNQDMASLGSSNKPILFGALDKYVVRRVRGIELFVFRERFMTQLQQGFMAYARFDGQLLAAGNPVRYLANSAT